MVQKASGEIFQAQTAYTLSIPVPPEVMILGNDTLKAGQCGLFRYKLVSLDHYKIKQAIWQFGDERHNIATEAAHVFRKPGNYNLKLLLIVHNERTQGAEKLLATKTITIIDDPATE